MSAHVSRYTMVNWLIGELEGKRDESVEVSKEIWNESCIVTASSVGDPLLLYALRVKVRLTSSMAS